jgi:hypothetical protein
VKVAVGDGVSVHGGRAACGIGECVWCQRGAVGVTSKVGVERVLKGREWAGSRIGISDRTGLVKQRQLDTNRTMRVLSSPPLPPCFFAGPDTVLPKSRST